MFLCAHLCEVLIDTLHCRTNIKQVLKNRRKNLANKQELGPSTICDVLQKSEPQRTQKLHRKRGKKAMRKTHFSNYLKLRLYIMHKQREYWIRTTKKKPMKNVKKYYLHRFYLIYIDEVSIRAEFVISILNLVVFIYEFSCIYLAV